MFQYSVCLVADVQRYAFYASELTKNVFERVQTPFGRYKFNRVPFGLSCAPEMFQRKIIQIFGDIPGVIIYFDDMGIIAGDEIEHDKL